MVLAGDGNRLAERVQEGDQVDELGLGQALGQTIRHQRDVAGPPILDASGGNRDALARRRLDHQLVRGLLDEQAGDDAAVGQRGDDRAEVIADRGAGAQDRAD